jgi:hypothetical protein
LFIFAGKEAKTPGGALKTSILIGVINLCCGYFIWKKYIARTGAINVVSPKYDAKYSRMVRDCP